VLRLLIEHDFNENILQGLKKRVPTLDALTARIIGFEEKPDTELLARAAAENRIVLIHDVQTMPTFAMARVRNDEAMSGLLVVPQRFPIGRAIDELAMVVLCSDENEWRDLIIYLPL
jgi:hypothetical protein